MLARKMTVPSAARHASPHRLRLALSSLMTLLVMAAPARADEPASEPPEPPKPAAEIGDDLDEVVEPAPPTRASYEDDHATSRSHLVPVLEVVGIEVAANLVSQAAGREWARISLDSMRANLTGEWIYDDDIFSVNQLGHPYGGALLYNAARSSGLGFWTSSAYAFTGSLAWETLMETNQPSINDQLTTSIGGALIGEALHRFGMAVRWGGGAAPSWPRRTLAAVIDPMGATNRLAFGERWRRSPPPRMHAYLGAGYSRTLAGPDGGPLHLEIGVSHGLPSDPRFEPRKPFHHFDLRGELDLGGDEDVSGFLDIRGMVVGRATGDARRRTLWGLYGTYDYWDAAQVRAGVFSVGPGLASHIGLGDSGFLELSALAGVVPLGAAGGTSDTLDQRDYHYGPGGTQIVEARLGKRGLGAVRASARAIEIYGDVIDERNEAVVVTSLGGVVALARNHALSAEVVYAAHHSRVDVAASSAFDQGAQVRVMYQVTSDDDFTGPAR